MLVLGYQGARASEHQRPDDQVQTMASSRTPPGAQWVKVLTHTSTAEHCGEAEIINDNCDGLRTFYLFSVPPPEHTPVPWSSFFHFSMEMKTAPGCMNTMQALDLGS